MCMGTCTRVRCYVSV